MHPSSVHPILRLENEMSQMLGVLWREVKKNGKNAKSLKGAVVVTRCQSEEEVKFQMDIDQVEYTK